jgi:hypothetical protein
MIAARTQAMEKTMTARRALKSGSGAIRSATWRPRVVIVPRTQRIA